MMVCFIRNIRFWPAALFLAVVIGLAASARADDDAVFPDIGGRFPQTAIEYKVSNRTIEYGNKVRIVLESGKLYRRPDHDSVDYFFFGKGRVEVVAADELDRFWRNRFQQKKEVEFRSAYLVGFDLLSLFDIDEADGHMGKINPRQRKRLQFDVKAPDKYFGVNLSGELATWSSEEPRPLPVWIDTEIDNDRRLVLSVSPSITEQLSLYMYSKLFTNPFLVAGFKLGDRVLSQPADIASYDIDLKLHQSGKFDGICRIRFSERQYPRGARLYLPYNFSVDSIFTEDGEEVPFLKEDRRSAFYLVPPVDRPEEEITIYYRGEFLSSFPVEHTIYDYQTHVASWYPRLPHWSMGEFTVTFELHKDVDLISIGKKISEEIDGDTKRITYRLNDLAIYASFATGVYEKMSDTSAAGTPIDLYIQSDNTGGLFNRNVPGELLGDFRRSFDTFTEWFGPPEAKSLTVVDEDPSYGQTVGATAAPGLIHWNLLFHDVDVDKRLLRAHEAAHQWWGHTVVPKTWRDTWLAEGMAEGSAGMYLLDIAGDTAEYLRTVDRWRNQIVESGRIYGSYSLGYKAGPITMGARFLSSYSPGDYVAIVYSKAAYMLQMLRFELDGPSYRTMFFQNMLKEFCSEYRDKKASTDDFVTVASKFLGENRARNFFENWLYGWKVPSFQCYYTVREEAKGDMVTIWLQASDVDPDFRTPFPVEIEFADGSRELFRCDNVSTERRDFPLGPFPKKVKNVRFDPYKIILWTSLDEKDHAPGR